MGFLKRFGRATRAFSSLSGVPMWKFTTRKYSTCWIVSVCLYSIEGETGDKGGQDEGSVHTKLHIDSSRVTRTDAQSDEQRRPKPQSSLHRNERALIPQPLSLYHPHFPKAHKKRLHQTEPPILRRPCRIIKSIENRRNGGPTIISEEHQQITLSLR